IRDFHVTGVQTCALPIFLFRTNSQSEALEQALTYRNIGYLVRGGDRFFDRQEVRRAMVSLRAATRVEQLDPSRAVRDILSQQGRSEERRVGKGCRGRRGR